MKYKRWRCMAQEYGRCLWVTVTSLDGTEGMALKATKVKFGYSPYAGKVQANPIRSTIINPRPLQGLHTEEYA